MWYMNYNCKRKYSISIYYVLHKRKYSISIYYVLHKRKYSISIYYVLHKRKYSIRQKHHIFDCFPLLNTKFDTLLMLVIDVLFFMFSRKIWKQILDFQVLRLPSPSIVVPLCLGLCCQRDINVKPYHVIVWVMFSYG
jgi:hypothetical protein